jgi:hypothetical protein
MRDRSKFLLKAAVICGCLWALFVLGVGAAVYLNKPWGHDPFVQHIGGQLAHCREHFSGGVLRPASYDWRDIVVCPKEHVAPMLEPSQKFLFAQMLLVALLPPILILLLAYSLAAAVSWAWERTRSAT